MATTKRGGRPSLNISTAAMKEAVRRERFIDRAAPGLGCSPSYIRARFKAEGITLDELLGERGLSNV